MVSKHGPVHTIICSQCHGNGFVRQKQIILQVWNFAISFARIKQCKVCNSQGEIKIDETKISNIYDADDGVDHHGYTIN